MSVLAAVCVSLVAQVDAASVERASSAPRLLDDAELVARMKAIADEHSDCARYVEVGSSREGRPIGALRLSDGQPPPGRPAILVVAQIDGPQTFSSAVALSHAEELAANRASDERLREFLATTTLYVVPRANPDAAHARFAKPLFELEATGRGIDDDRDRRDGEDPPSDVDGDGAIAWMRWKDPRGAWIADPTDARAMRKADAKKGERGEYELALEGRDLDHDETPSEDAPRDAIVNQNFAYEWQEHGAHAGRFPMDEPEARALAEFVLQHKDIALVVTYGTLDTLIEKPKSVADNAPAQKRIPPAGWLESDAALLSELSKRYAERTSNKTKGRGVEAGSFQAWAYQHRGLWSLAIPLWDIPIDAKAKGDASGDKPQSAPAESRAADAPRDAAINDPHKDDARESESASSEGKSASKDGERKRDAKDKAEKSDKSDEPKPSDDALRLKWIDAHGDGARFLPWKPFDHPELGRVEIGGFAPFARSEPPTAEWASIARRELEFLLTLGADLPRIAIAEFRAKPLSGGVYELEAALHDDALLPLESKAAQRAECARPLRVKLVLPSGATLLGGAAQTLVRDLGGKARKELRWLVLCEEPTAIELQIDSDNAGSSATRARLVDARADAASRATSSDAPPGATRASDPRTTNDKPEQVNQ